MHQSAGLHHDCEYGTHSAGPDRWVQLTSGEYHDDKQQFSPDGNTMYFTSNRDGFTCIWAQRLDPKTKQPLGAPFPIEHFHGGQRIYSGISQSNDMEVNVAKDKIEPRRVSLRHLDDGVGVWHVTG